MMRRIRNAPATSVIPGMQAVAVVALLLITLLTTVACGAGYSPYEPPPVIPTATPTAAPLPSARSDSRGVYYLSSDSLNGTTVGALGPSDGASHWQTLVPGATDLAVVGSGALYVGEGTQGRSLPGQIPMEALSEANGAMLWRSQFPAMSVAPLAISGDRVFVQIDGLTPPTSPAPGPNTPTPTPAPPPAPNAIVALRAGQRTPLWRLDLQEAIAPWAFADGDTLYAILYSQDPSAPLGGDLTAINAQDGSVRWRLPLQSALPAYSAPVESGGVLYFSEQYCACRTLIPSIVVAVRASDGKLLWRQATPDGAVTTGAMVLTGGMVSYSYLRASNAPGGGVVALHAADGSPAWQVSWPKIAPDGFTGGDGDLYVIEEAADVGSPLVVVAYDAQTGAMRFERSIQKLPVQLDGTPGEGTLRESGGALYFVTPGMPVQTGATARLVSGIVALRASDGSLMWARALDGLVQSAFFIVP